MDGGMIDITRKPVVYREATAEGTIKLRKTTIERIREGGIEKGDVFEAAKIAALNAVKKTPELLPYCHPIPITSVKTVFELVDEDKIRVLVTVKTSWKTGVEMEALAGATAALLTIWDMVKKYEKDGEGQYPYTEISRVRVVEKKKGNPG